MTWNEEHGSWIQFGKMYEFRLRDDRKGRLFFFKKKNECKVANKVSVCFEWLWKGPFVWLCLLLSRKRTFPRVLFILIFLFLPLSSSRFWQTQSSKCGQTRKSEFCPFMSSCLFLFALYALCIFPLRASRVWIISPFLDLFSHSSLVATEQLFGKMG